MTNRYTDNTPVDEKDSSYDDCIIVNDLESQSQSQSQLTSSRNFRLKIVKYLYISWFLISIPFFYTNLTKIITNNFNYSTNDYDLSKSLILNSLETNLAGDWLKDYSRDNQLAGTNLKMVNYTAEKFIQLGLKDVFIDEYTSFMSYPLDNGLKLINKNTSEIIFNASLIEDEIDEDENSKTYVPAFLGFAANGNVTSQYIYCNYGTMEDFQKLNDLGIDLKGKIAIIRYGKIYRGLKIKFAQENEMIGVLIYTDTMDDGNVIVQNGFKPYPKGFARNPSAIQRGSALFLSINPGDPTTPGYAIKPGESNSRSSPYKSIPKIPALPVSFKEIQPFLEKISGYGHKFDNWNGLVENFDYSTGPNPDYEINLFNKQDFNISTMYNIMGKIEGYDDSKFLLIGNHHDSWTPAAADPHSGSSTMLEIIRAFGSLTKSGWKPRISIIFASWDGEEYGLIGSTEFAEYHSKKLKKECVAYINTDVSTIGNILDLKASPLLNDILLSTLKELNYPNSEKSLYEHFIEKSGSIGTLGSGSDYTVFLEHLGIPSVDMGFNNDLKNSSVYQYHSLYDSFYWMEKFGDPKFIYHNLMAKYMSLLILHLSTDPILNLRTHDYSIGINDYFENLEIPDNWYNKSIDENHHKHYCNKSYTEISTILINEIKDKLTALQLKSLEFDAKLEELVDLYKHWDSLSYFQRIKLHFKAKGINTVLHFYERHLLDDEGLNDRSWFKHIVYASGRYTGYKGQELPGLAEAIEDNDIKDFVHRLKKLNDILSTLIRINSV
ncbi:hypothetical protein DAPK24_012860 [Pichia kluyveri]|uniref:Vacuolar membrane protease n=1 Tax=Pichia kluyveri TaxID=36015 RepID=A0AAV5R255_PICKL|nr:hypothetical protein DAPK24_012860 [Pichia kluyveri]